MSERIEQNYQFICDYYCVMRLGNWKIHWDSHLGNNVTVCALCSVHCAQYNGPMWCRLYCEASQKSKDANKFNSHALNFRFGRYWLSQTPVETIFMKVNPILLCDPSWESCWGFFFIFLLFYSLFLFIFFLLLSTIIHECITVITKNNIPVCVVNIQAKISIKIEEKSNKKLYEEDE